MDNNNTTKVMKKQNSINSDAQSTTSKSLTSKVAYSELIAKLIVNKIISLSITEGEIREIEYKIGDKCFFFSHKIIQAYLSTAFIPYERDDKQGQSDNGFNTLPLFDNVEDIFVSKDQTETEVINKDYDLKENPFVLNNYFYNNWYRGENKWNSMNEPLNCEPDRYASSFVTIEKIDNKKSNYAVSNNDLFQPITTEGDIRRNSRTLTKITKDVLNVGSIQKKKLKRKPTVDFGSNDIQTKECFFDEPTELYLNELRQEKELELKKIEEENKKIIRKQIEIQEKSKEVIMKQKEYAKANITVDSNGQIVFIKGYSVEALSNEFIAAKAELKEVRRVISGSKQTPVNQKKKKENGVIQLVTPLIESKSEKIQNKSHKNEKKVKETLTSTPNLNPYDKDRKSPVIIPVIRDPHKDLVPYDNPYGYSGLSLEKKILRGPINPSGSCFDLISLEIGVSFAEDKKYKAGGKDFYRAFNKYSIENYNKQVKDNENQSIMSSNAYRTSTDYNYNNMSKYQANLTDHSLFNFNSTTSELNRPNISNLKTLMSNSNSFNPSIKLGKQNIVSLRSAIDEVNLITESQERNNQFNDSLPKDIFKEKIDNTLPSFTKIKKQLEPMNLFAKSILSSEKWGANNNIKQKISNENIRIPYKAKSKIKELEININPNIEHQTRNKLQREKLRNAGLNTFYSSTDNKLISPTQILLKR